MNKLIFSNESEEYISNGVYLIGGILFSTLWAWKKCQAGYQQVNTAGFNAGHGHELKSMGYPSIETRPDYGGFESVAAYPVVSIEYFFTIK